MLKPTSMLFFPVCRVHAVLRYADALPFCNACMSFFFLCYFTDFRVTVMISLALLQVYEPTLFFVDEFTSIVRISKGWRFLDALVIPHRVMVASFNYLDVSMLQFVIKSPFYANVFPV